MLSKFWYNEKCYLEDELVKMMKDIFLFWVLYECFDIGEVFFFYFGLKECKWFIEIIWEKKMN